MPINGAICAWVSLIRSRTSRGDKRPRERLPDRRPWRAPTLLPRTESGLRQTCSSHFLECCLQRGCELGSLARLMLVEQLTRVLGNGEVSATVCIRQYIPHWVICKSPDKLLSIWIPIGRSPYKTLPGRAQASPISSRPVDQRAVRSEGFKGRHELAFQSPLQRSAPQESYRGEHRNPFPPCLDSEF